MAIRFFDQASDCLHSGSHQDSRLFHVDSSDQIKVWSPQVGQGYIQIIPLQEELSLVILDYAIHSTFFCNSVRRNRYLEVEFQLAGSAAGQSTFVPCFAPQNELKSKPAQPRQFNVEIVFSSSMFESYSRALVEQMTSQDQTILYDWADWVHFSRRGYGAKSSRSAFDQILNGTITSPQVFSVDDPFEKLDVWAFGRFWRSITSEMHRVINQILSCPYSGRVRRTYLRRKALELVALKLRELNYLDAISYPLVKEDIDSVYQAGKILVRNLDNPPSIETLARQVGLNRLKLNQGFRQVYGTTPFRYLRNCRLALAVHLLSTSELAVEEVAYRVGYISRTSFTGAFRRQFGFSPKALQLQVLQRLQPQNHAS